MSDYVIIVREATLHPESMLERIVSRFMPTSIISAANKDSVLNLKKGKPLFDSKYLVIFEGVSAFKETLSLIRYENMFVILHVETGEALDEAIFLCREKDVQYKVYDNKFTRDHANLLITQTTTSPVSKEVRNAIIRHTGLNPSRILSAVSVCEQVGFSVSNVNKYVDKWLYPDIRTMIRVLLGLHVTKVSYTKCLQYLHNSRYMFRYIRKSILSEIDSVIQVYEAKISGSLNDMEMLDFLDENHITHARATFALELFSEVSLPSIIALREFIRRSQMLELVAALTL